MILRELDPPHRQTEIAIVLHAISVPWLADKVGVGQYMEIGNGGKIFINGKQVAEIIRK